MLSSTFETGPKVCKPCVSRHPHALKWKHTQHMWHCSFFTRKKKGNKLSHPNRKFAFTESFASILSPGAYKTNQLRDWQATWTTSYFKTLNHVADAGEKPLQGIIILHTCQLSPGLSGSLPDTTPTSRSPVRVTISPGWNHLLSFSMP